LQLLNWGILLESFAIESEIISCPRIAWVDIPAIDEVVEERHFDVVFSEIRLKISSKELLILLGFATAEQHRPNLFVVGN